MENKTESYIVLKPIAERFSRVANEITDDEIKSLIKSEMRDQMKKVDFVSHVEDIVSEYVDDNQDEILDMFKRSISDKLESRI